MTKSEFLDILKRRLGERNVPDSEEIAQEYEQHFEMKEKDGYSQEEIAGKLGDPAALADQYEQPGVPPGHGTGRKLTTGIGLAFTDIFVGMFFVLMLAFEAVLGVFALACAAGGVGLVFNLRGGLLPSMPYGIALIFAAALFALAALAVIGVWCWHALVRQLMRVFGRFHRNTAAAASGKAALPPLSMHMGFSPVARRRLRKLTVAALCVFAVSFVMGYIVSAFAAGALEWWHTWGWFVR